MGLLCEIGMNKNIGINKLRVANQNNEVYEAMIVPATIEDAPFIARTIMEALGEEICASFVADGSHTLRDVEELFSVCAASDDSQYSWRNTLKAIDPAGNVLGMAVSYNGKDLYTLRKRFLDEFEKRNGRRIDEYMTDETTPGEWYLDSLAVFPPYRGRGIARRLIEGVQQKGRQAGLPVGLLVEKTNHRARGLYDRMGFRPEGTRKFAGEEMDHLLLKGV